jgi:hypothetical protein
LFLAGLYAAPAVHAGATFKIDDTKWLSIGAGLKTSFAAVDDQAGVDGDKWNTDFFLNNIRLYLNGQLHEYIKLTFNTECHNCSDGGSVRVLDAIARFEFNDYSMPGSAGPWCRPSVPSSTARSTTHSSIPSERAPSSRPTLGCRATRPFRGIIPPLGHRPASSVVMTAWSCGVSLIPNKRLKYAIGGFSGLDDDDINPDREFQCAARLAYNFWNIEDNPGYYTSSTYYGGRGHPHIGRVEHLWPGPCRYRHGLGQLPGERSRPLMEKVLPNEGW